MENQKDMENCSEKVSEEGNVEEKGSRSEAKKEILSWVKVMLIAFLVAFIVSHFIIINARIPSVSMENTIKVGDTVIGNRLAYKFSNPEKGEIVLFVSPENAGQHAGQIFIKRLIGEPGDVIYIEHNVLYINGEAQTEDYVDSWKGNDFKMIYNPELNKMQLYDDISQLNLDDYKIPKDRYFVMGDNRDGSGDSRAWGTVERSAFVAKAMFRWWPLSKISTLK